MCSRRFRGLVIRRGGPDPRDQLGLALVRHQGRKPDRRSDPSTPSDVASPGVGSTASFTSSPIQRGHEHREGTHSGASGV
jgi:hypothetical protein